MRRYRQTVDELLDSLTPLRSTWRDSHATKVIELLAEIPSRMPCDRGSVERLFLADGYLRRHQQGAF